MNDKQPDEPSYGLSYDETLFPSYQKVPEVKIICSCSKEVDL